MMNKVVLELDEQGFAEYTNAIIAYRNADVVAMASEVVGPGYGAMDKRLLGINVTFLKETDVIILLRKQIEELKSRK